MKTNFKFNNFYYDVNNILTPTDITLAINKFFLEILSNKDPNFKFVILFKIKTSEGDWRNISSLQTFDSTRIDDLIQVFILWWSIRSDIYKGLTVDRLVLRYRFIESDIAPSKCIIKYPSDLDKKEELLPEAYANLPNNRLFETWGDSITINGDNTYLVSNEDDKSYFIRQFDNEYFVTLMYKDIEMLNFHDVYDPNSDSNNTFMRTIGTSEAEQYFRNGVCYFIKQPVKSNYIKPKTPDVSIKDNFLTMDLETRSINNIMHVISASIYDGNKIKSFYLLDFKDSDSLVKEAILYTLQRKYNGYRVYLHNLKFDMTFMLRVISKMKSCEIKQFLKRDSKIISLNVIYNLDGKRKYNIHFRDSCLLLPSKLRDLGKNFSVDVKKSIYPYKFVNKIDTPLDYIGKVPSIDYFDGINKDDYVNYCNNINKDKWSLRDETVLYCENDVISLYLILKEFQKKIFRLFEADINKYPTLSSLAFSIYRLKYLNGYKIPIITGELYRNLKKSYTGGSVDVYKPVGNNINRYDVNSLYPSVMYDFPSPVGKITKFKGNIFEHEKNPFGFFYVKIKTPENLHIPILQTRVKTEKNGVRTISPLGEWNGWYFSEEIHNAKKYGYEFEVVWGYLFEKEYIFKDYVNDLYELKKKSSKNTPDYTISKLLLNSLYGRFGMSPDKETHEIVKGEHNIGRYLNLHNEGKIYINDFTELDNTENIELISYSKNKKDEDNSMFENINVAISSSITAYARIKMSEIKYKYSSNIYYSDTDSIDLDIKLPSNYISNKLGDYKLEHTFEKVLYIAPKVYAAITTNEEYIKKNKTNQFIIIKGYKDEKVEFDKIYNLVNKNENLILKHEKWYQDLSKGRIVKKEDSYTLLATENKRKLVYENNKLSKTVPYKLINNKLI